MCVTGVNWKVKFLSACSTGKLKKKTDQDSIVNITDLIKISYLFKLFLFNNQLTSIYLMDKSKMKLISADFFVGVYPYLSELLLNKWSNLNPLSIC